MKMGPQTTTLAGGSPNYVLMPKRSVSFDGSC
jgi:hypothetical protein